MTATSNSIETLTPEHEVAGLFRLPPELRDLIYDHCYQKQRYMDAKTPPGCPVLYFDIRTPLPQLHMVSRRVQIEYDKRSLANRYLQLSLEEFIPHFKPYDRLPRLARTSTRLDLRLEFTDGFMKYWDSPGGLTLPEIISSALPTLHEDLPDVKDLRVCIRFGVLYCNYIPRLMRSMERFAGMSKEFRAKFTRLENLTVISMVWEGLDMMHGLMDIRLARWTSKYGLALNTAALDAHRKECTMHDWCRQEHHNIDDVPSFGRNRSYHSHDSASDESDISDL